MNNFRDNLHFAFFDVETWESPEEVEKEADVGTDLAELWNEVQTDVQEFPDVALDVIREEMNRYSWVDAWKFRQDQKIFVERLRSEPQSSSEKSYNEKWDKAIKTGYENLIGVLESENYFDGLDDAAKTAKIDQIKEKYYSEVKKQYIDNVWRASDKKFDKVKDNLFGPNAEIYLPTKIREELVKEAERQRKSEEKQLQKEQKRKEAEQENRVTTEKVDNEIWTLGNNVVWNIGRESYEFMQQDKLTTPEMKEMAMSRHNENIDNWNKNVKKWYEHLLKTLDKNRYFDSPTAKRLEDIHKMYVSEVTDQYDKYVWDSDEETFDRVKDDLFTKDMWDEYPANVVYKKLNHDADILRQNLENREAYSVVDNHENLEEESEVVSEKQSYREKFLSEKFPNYLWTIKSTTFGQELLKRTPIVSNTIEKNSDKDKDGIKDFVNLAERVSKMEWSWETPELTLIQIFKDAQNDWTDAQWLDAFEKNGIKVVKRENSFLKDVHKAYKFYREAQEPNQHNIYLSILKVVEDYGGFDKTIAAFKDKVEESSDKKDKKAPEKLQDANSDLYAIAEKFHMDYESALRLAEMDPESFKSKDVLSILADFNNDGVVAPHDQWIKTWQQFMRVAERIWREKALNNLLDHAKLLNQTQKVWIDENSFTVDEIQNGNKPLILFLQNIIAQPWEDFWQLLEYWTDAAKKNEEILSLLDRAPKWPKDPEVQQAVNELLEWLDLKLEDIENIDWFEQAATPEWLHEAIAGALYTEYKEAIGLWARISFEEWVKWLALNGWVQVGDTWVSLWLSLSYRADINLWKWWKMTPGVSFGYIPFVSYEWDFNHWLNAGGWLEIDKEWIDKHNVAKRFWVELNYTRVIETANVYSAFVWVSKDKLVWIEYSMERMQDAFNSVAVSILEDINNLNGGKIDFDDENSRRNIETFVRGQIYKALGDEKNELSDTWRNALIQYTMRFLSNFNGMDISSDVVRNRIASHISEQFALARREAATHDIDDDRYFSWWSLWASLVQVWTWWSGVIHAWLKWTKHQADGYVDDLYGEYSIDTRNLEDKGEITDAMLTKINKHLDENQKLSFNEEWYVVVPESLFRNAWINPEMKWKIKKDDNGNILLHKQTYVDLPMLTMWTATESLRWYIGWWDVDNMESLNGIKDDSEWFADGDIDTTQLTWKEWFTMDLLREGLDWLKQRVPDLQDFYFNESTLNQLENGYKYKITIQEDGRTWKTDVEKVFDNDALPLTIEYKWHKWAEMMSKEAQEVANHMYGEAQKVTSNALYNISHNKNNKLYPDYDKFAHAVIEKEYNEARDTISKMLPEMDKYINQYQQKTNQVDFYQVAGALQNLEWEELWKALMSINNIFARVSSVHGGTDWKYHFVWYKGENMDEMVEKPMWSIVEARAKEISWKIDRSNLDPETKAAYQSLIAFAEKDRQDNSEKYEDSSKEAKTLYNAIWINLWNRFKLENPLFNPEVYEDSIIPNPEFKWRDTLLLHALDIIAKNETLIDPIKEQLWIKWPVKKITIDKNNDQLMLDIWQEKVKLSAEMKFAYFAQCVNHMLIIDNIRAEAGDNVSVDLWNSVLWKWKVREWSARPDMSTRTVTIGVAGKAQFDGSSEVSGEVRTEQTWTTWEWTWTWWDKEIPADQPSEGRR